VSTIEERSYVEAARREKRAELERLGIQAYAYRYERSHTAAAALALYRDEMGDAGPRVRIAGRVNRLGSHGKTTFAHLEDSTGRIQVYFRQDALRDQYHIVGLLDLDDHIGVEGTLFRTKKGEVTVKAGDLTLLSKSLRPLPRGSARIRAPKRQTRRRVFTWRGAAIA